MSESTHNTAEQQRSAWDSAWSDSYEEAIAFITSQSGQTAIACELGDIRRTSRVLDVGCGPGILSESLAQVAGSVVGIDFLETMITQANERRSGAHFQVADAEHVPFHDNHFDVAVCCYTSHHFAHPERVYRELSRVLVPGGRVVVLHPIQAECAAFRAIYATLAQVLSTETVSEFPSLAGPLYNVSSPEPYRELLTHCGFVNIVAEARRKDCTLPNEEALIRATAQIGQLDATSDSVRSTLVSASDANAAQYRLEDGSYRFPDRIIVARGVKA